MPTRRKQQCSGQLSLFTADFLQALGVTMHFKWIYDGKVRVGNFCNAQGRPLVTFFIFVVLD
jgi:folate-binding Fe-S cluster repair protein YgfZ